MANPAANPTGFLDALTATTVQDILPTVADNVYRSDVLFAMLRENNLRTWQGRQINENFLYNVENGGFYATGSTFDITQKQVNTAGAWLPKNLYTNVTLNLEMTEVYNMGPQAVVSIADTRMQNAALTSAARLAIALYQGGQAGNGRELALNGMPEILNDGVTAGYDGQIYANYGTVPRNGTIGRALNSPMTVADSGFASNISGPIILPTLNGLLNSVMIGTSYADVAITTNLGMTYISNKMQPFQRTETQDAKLGFNSVVYKQTRFFASQYAPGTVVPERGTELGFPTGLTGETLWLLASKDFRLYEAAGLFGLQFTGWKVAQDNNSIAGQQLFAGNVINISPRQSRYAFNITG